MPTIASLPPTATTDAPQVFSCRGSTQLQISVTVAGVFLAFANTQQGVVQGFGQEEYHAAELFTISDEAIGAVQFRSAVSGTPATIVINAST